MNKIQKEKEEAQKAFLMRLFEDIIDINDSTLKNKDHEKWLNSFAEKVSKLATGYIICLSCQYCYIMERSKTNTQYYFQIKVWKSEVAAPKTKGEDESNEDTTDQLKAQVEHYKGVLGETVSIKCFQYMWL